MASYMLPICLFVAVLSIVSAAPPEEKPLDCPANEVYYKCNLAKCWKNCSDLKNPPPCPSISADCFKPACECDDDYLRNAEGKCVPEKYCGVTEVPH